MSEVTELLSYISYEYLYPVIYYYNILLLLYHYYINIYTIYIIFAKSRCQRDVILLLSTSGFASESASKMDSLYSRIRFASPDSDSANRIRRKHGKCDAVPYRQLGSYDSLVTSVGQRPIYTPAVCSFGLTLLSAPAAGRIRDGTEKPSHWPLYRSNSITSICRGFVVRRCHGDRCRQGEIESKIVQQYKCSCK